jgi:arylsulfatase A-like enzyme
VGHVIDIVPTLLEITGISATKKDGSEEAPPLAGRSLVPALKSDVPVAREFLYFHHENNRALRMGDWKLVSKRPATNEYALYDLSRDRGEQKDLTVEQPERAAAMARRWQEIEGEFRRVYNVAP